MKKNYGGRGLVYPGLLVSILLVFVLMGCEATTGFLEQMQEANSANNAFYWALIKEFWKPLLVYFAVSLIVDIVLQKIIPANKKGKTLMITGVGLILAAALVFIIRLERIGGWKGIIAYFIARLAVTVLIAIWGAIKPDFVNKNRGYFDFFAMTVVGLIAFRISSSTFWIAFCLFSFASTTIVRAVLWVTNKTPEIT
jgi:hypothetical protein